MDARMLSEELGIDVIELEQTESSATTWLWRGGKATILSFKGCW